MDGGQPDLRRGGAGMEEEEGSWRKEKKGRKKERKGETRTESVVQLHC
jgi:hypothetical protein